LPPAPFDELLPQAAPAASAQPIIATNAMKRIVMKVLSSP
jgi:hypothetical protein